MQKKKRKKKRRFGYYLYAAVALILAIANTVIALYLLTFVQDISVSGNRYSQQVMIRQWIQEDKKTSNSLYAVLKFKLTDPELPTYLESVSVGWKTPWSLSVKVKEKEVVAAILEKKVYNYVAADGTILKKSSDLLDGIPVIEGVRTEDSVLFQTIRPEEERALTSALEIAEEISRNRLTPESVVWEDDGMSLYFGDIKVLVGRINYRDKLMQITPILEKLEGRKGVLHLEHYHDEMGTSISFTEEDA